MNNIGELRFYFSGGATNTDANLSIGGAISTATGGECVSQTFAPTTAAMSGITIVDGTGNPLGIGTMTFTYATRTLKWKSPGDSFGAEVNIPSGASGRFVLESGTIGSIVVLTAGVQPTADSSLNFTVAQKTSGIFDFISTAESTSGDTEYRCIYIKNIATSGTAVNTRVWLLSDAVGADSVEIGKGSAAYQGVEQLVADEGTAPADVTFSAPADYASGIVMGDIGYGGYQSLWIKRSIPASTTTSTPDDYFTLGYACDIA